MGRQPRRGPAAAAHSIDDEIGRHDFLRTARCAADDPDTAYSLAPGSELQPHHVAAIDDVHGRACQDPVPYVSLKERPAGLDGGRPDGCFPQHMAIHAEPEVGQRLGEHSSVRDHLLDDPGVQLTDQLSAARHQGVGVPALRNSPPTLPGQREEISFDEGDLVVGVAENAGGEQAGPHDNRPSAEFSHRVPPVRCG